MRSFSVYYFIEFVDMSEDIDLQKLMEEGHEKKYISFHICQLMNHLNLIEKRVSPLNSVDNETYQLIRLIKYTRKTLTLIEENLEERRDNESKL